MKSNEAPLTRSKTMTTATILYSTRDTDTRAMGRTPSAADIRTFAAVDHLLVIEAGNEDADPETLESLFSMANCNPRWQSDVQPIIEAQRITHTSMSIGDIVVLDTLRAYLVAPVGFQRLSGAQARAAKRIAFRQRRVVRALKGED